MRAQDFLAEISPERLERYLARADRHVSNRMDRMSQARQRLSKSYEIYHADRPAGSAQIVDRFEADTPEQARQYYEKFIQNYDSDVDFDLRLRKGTGIMEARLPRSVEDFLYDLTPDDVGVDEIGPWRIYYEGFTDDCQSSADYRKNPEAVYQQVFADHIAREDGRKPVEQNFTGDEDYPILYSIFRIPKQVKEAFDAPYPMKWEHSKDSHDALVKLPDGTNLSIMFSKEYMFDNEEDWHVEFWRNNSQEVTGEGDQQRVFATVLAAIKEFIKIENPERMRFSADKDADAGGRASLYSNLVKRYANSWGYEVDTSEYGGSTVFNLYKLYEDTTSQQYLWHGSREPIKVLEPRQAQDTGGAAGSNQNAIYATSDPKVAIAMGLTTPGSDTGMFPNDPQMVLFKGQIRHGQNVYLHKLPFNGPDGRPQFVQGGNTREFHSVPGVTAIQPIEIKAVPVDKYSNLIRQATPQDLELQKKYSAVTEVTTVPTVAKGKRAHLDVMPNDGKPIKPGEEAEHLGKRIGRLGSKEVWTYNLGTLKHFAVFDPESRRSQLAVSGSRYPDNPDSFIVHGLYSGPSNDTRAANLYAWLVTKLGLTLVSDIKQSPGGYRVWQDMEKRFGRYMNVYAFNTKTDEPLNLTTLDEPETHVGQEHLPGATRDIKDIAKNVRLVASPK